VTHDQAEAMTLGDRVAVLNNGHLQQCDTPRKLYECPTNTFVAGFIGSPSMNLVRLPLASNGSVSLGGVDIPLPPAVAQNGAHELLVGLRPESLELAADGVSAEVEVVEEVGADAYVFCVSEVASEAVKLVARTETRSAPARGARVALRPRPEEAQLFDPESGRRLGD
jgi:multiple sugar transport system ATP-binding protein